MRKSFKKWVVLLMVAVFIVSVSVSFAKPQTTIKFVRWGSPAEEQSFRNVIAGFMKKNPDINVEINFTPWSQYFDKLNLSIASGDMADVVGMSTAAGSGYYVDAFENLAPYVKRDKVPTKRFAGGLLEAGSYNNKLYGLATDMAIWTMTYNKAIFDAAGVPYPAATKPMTWDQFTALAAKLTKAGGVQVGFNDQDNLPARLLYMVASCGGKLTADGVVNPHKIGLQTAQDKKALERLTQLFKSIPPVSEWGKQWDGGLLNNKVAMATAGPWMFADYNKAGIKFGVIPMPEGVPDAKVTGLVNLMMMSKSSKNKAAAWKLIKYFTSIEGQKVVGGAGIGIPIYPELLTAPEFLKAYPGVDMSAYIYVSKHFQIWPITPSFDLEAFYTAAMKDLAEGKITVDQFITRTATEGQKTLDGAYKK